MNSPSDKALSDADLLEDARRSREESVRFFSASNKPMREKWVALHFLKNLGIEVEDHHLEPVSSDPPDILYKGCRFEIKEILDPGRKRHEEYKQALAKARMATSASELWEVGDARTIVYTEIEQLVLKHAEALVSKYDPRTRETLDLLFYVSLNDVFGYVAQPLAKTELIEKCGFRSVSFLAGPLSAVLGASAQAPSVLSELRGKVIREDSRNGAA